MNIENKLKETEKFIPPLQLEQIKKRIKLYKEEISRLYKLVKTIPKIGESKDKKEPKVYLHYFTGNNDYYIYEFDGEDTFLGKACLGGFPDDGKNQKFSLSNLKSNTFIELELN